MIDELDVISCRPFKGWMKDGISASLKEKKKQPTQAFCLIQPLKLMSFFECQENKRDFSECMQPDTIGFNWCQGDVGMNGEMPI